MFLYTLEDLECYFTFKDTVGKCQISLIFSSLKERYRKSPLKIPVWPTKFSKEEKGGDRKGKREKEGGEWGALIIAKMSTHQVVNGSYFSRYHLCISLVFLEVDEYVHCMPF